jgi:hypothetical protein
MKSLFAYIFAKSYFVCINVFREKEFPFAWGTAVLVIFLILNFWSILGVFEFFFFLIVLIGIAIINTLPVLSLFYLGFLFITAS